MAANFSSSEDICEGENCEQSCEQQDIEGVIMKSRASLNTLREMATDKLQLCRNYGDQIQGCRIYTDNLLHALKNEVDSVINEAIQTDEDREKEDAAKINQEIDEKNQNLEEEIQKIKEEIGKNDEERENRLELNRKNAEKRRKPIDEKQHSLQTDIQNIAKEKEKKIAEIEKTWQNDMKTTKNTEQTLDTVLEDDNNFVKDGHLVKTSVIDELKKPLNEGEVKQVTDTISGVRFVKGAGREKYDGRIDGYDGEWTLIDTINVSDEIKYPAIAGCIDECDVIITDKDLSGQDTYMFNMNTKHTQRVITNVMSCVVSCALLNDDKVVCGKYSPQTGGSYTGDSLTGFINVYDRQWDHINDVTIPINTPRYYTRVDVAVDQIGIIIAAEEGQSKIYVINPADGKIMHTITCKQGILIRGVLSSGHIVAQPYPPEHRVFIIDRKGAQREITHSGLILNTCIDPITDDLYVVTSDDECKTCVIDQVMSGGDMDKRRVASFPLSSRCHPLQNRLTHLVTSRVVMTSSGNMIACDVDNILVFKKLLSL
eukprot:XP_011660462.1 PREDICTED: uncharacterized protein LOC105436535 [Strongylocentrotus purpuratus]